jgi:uncharacterized protein DUF5658
LNKGLSATLWRHFWSLVVLQAADLVTTYWAFSTRAGHEGNLLLRGLELTPAAPVLKVFALVFLALLIIRSTGHGVPAPHRLLILTSACLVTYTLIVLNNVLVLLRV